MFHIYSYLFILYGYIINSKHDQLPVGLIAQLVEHCSTAIAEVMDSNPLQAWICFRVFSQQSGCVDNCRIFSSILSFIRSAYTCFISNLRSSSFITHGLIRVGLGVGFIIGRILASEVWGWRGLGFRFGMLE